MTQNSAPFRIGQGYDIHALVPNRKLILGGVHIPSDKGLMGTQMQMHYCMQLLMLY